MKESFVSCAASKKDKKDKKKEEEESDLLKQDGPGLDAFQVSKLPCLLGPTSVCVFWAQSGCKLCSMISGLIIIPGLLNAHADVNPD